MLESAHAKAAEILASERAVAAEILASERAVAAEIIASERAVAAEVLASERAVAAEILASERADAVEELALASAVEAARVVTAQGASSRAGAQMRTSYALEMEARKARHGAELAELEHQLEREFAAKLASVEANAATELSAFPQYIQNLLKAERLGHITDHPACVDIISGIATCLAKGTTRGRVLNETEKQFYGILLNSGTTDSLEPTDSLLLRVLLETHTMLSLTLHLLLRHRFTLGSEIRQPQFDGTAHSADQDVAL